tara:strand:- start:5172 stop:5297 length:126 start_codon:yes stop_codon:yes gene_type:complete
MLFLLRVMAFGLFCFEVLDYNYFILIPVAAYIASGGLFLKK